MNHPVHGRLDAGLRLVETDAALASLHARAGGEPQGVIAVPQLAQVARLARRLGVAISRGVVAADGEGEAALWVRAAPDGNGVRLSIVAWTERQPASAPAIEQDFLRAEADLTWEADAALRLTAMWPAPPVPGLVGEPVTRAFTLLPDATGALPLVEAMAEQRAFDGQPAEFRAAGGAPLLLAGTPLFDTAGRLRGFRGTAVPRSPAPPETTPAAGQGDAFATRLGEVLKAPLDRIIRLADAIGARDEGPLRRDYAGYAADIATASRHLLALVGDLVDLSAIERPDFQPERGPIDLADLARRAAGLLAIRALNGEVRIDPPKVDETLSAIGEYRRVLQILVNLVGNAVRYSPPGSAVWLRGEAAGAEVRLTVADQGKGIAPEDQVRIFDKFERVDPDEPGGTGLGLYISRRLARAMDGDLTVDSAPGQGARFTLILPAG
ncbi:sensor histidine kinase [Sphingomonas jatrophae]|uniref:histidine kinase n=1 Tax=Sphingomonas jatrophae TaxID=1166337 RepID=A0A1I6JV33_9SPHN|nr:HAMP domain-containing sensor histidine kinase [Sphingomonas jatrophae]SFR82813.1 histidine kinase [Sphingomonas jatrophae]